ncbi:multicopper oxidase family protein [Terasakiella sp. A23]|uniref:multicopper oxidase family protein n=1 Tax=Terasakiella sp. FCG-A23 TaxID=3080561 RepID=UPI0029532FC2|nr:multicopper oxidase family protein [Terasakiella sp. A23]MDV7340641.1 multicopper oxidase family protein [Terasakiella sp. A23]
MTKDKKDFMNMPRRQFLQTVGGAGATAFGLGACAIPPGFHLGGEDLKQPPVETSHDGLLDTQVSAQYGNFFLGGQPVHLRCYNGNPVGNTLDFRGGDTVRLKLTNNMPFIGDFDLCTDKYEPENTPRGFNITNMHVHGLHVSPKQPSDDILIWIDNGDSYQYEYQIPPNHPPGTYFYHAHVHGSTAIQVASGMAGCMIVRGDLDDIPAIKAAKEQVMMIQTQRFGDDGTCESFGLLNNGDMTYINGQLNPTIRIKKGEVQRWRLVNASHMVPFDLSIQTYRYTTQNPMTLIGRDGNPLTHTKEVDYLRMVPGNRADVLVKGFDPGTYFLSGGDNMGTIATIIVEEESVPDMTLYAGPLPQPPELAPIPESEVTFGRRIEFGFAYGNQPKFTINDVPFSCEDDWKIPLNAVEEWEVYNHTAYPHPFHIHVNPFQVVSGGYVDPGTWMDTLEFPAFERIKFRTRFLDFTGEFVFHCHNLMHEDMGMMQAVTVFDPKHPDKA